MLTPKAITDTGWDGLVKILDDGGYVRYDYSTASKLLGLVEHLQKKYGSLNRLHRQAKGPRDLERKLMEFKGIGPVTANIFLRELRTTWKNADPEPLDFVKEQAAKLEIELSRCRRKTRRFVMLEAALIRCRKQKKTKSGEK